MTKGRLCLRLTAGLIVAACAMSPANAAVLDDGDQWNGWTVVFAGYGSVTATGSRMTLRPAQATSPDVTHAALVVSTTQHDDVRLKTRVTLNAQLRKSANPWECGWLVIRYADPDHFYYAALKTNGWEIGKRDPAYPGGQRFLATGSTPKANVGDALAATLQATGRKLVLKIDGTTVATVTDSERPYSAGAVGLYTEDADVTFDKIAITDLS